jgi:DNA-binding NarL/FixJ family response regulator
MLRKLIIDLHYEVSGDARTGAEAIPLILETNPDLVILDLSMQPQNGFEVMEELRAKSARCRFLVFTGAVGAHTVERLHRMRLHGIVSKRSNVTELEEGVKAVLAGRRYCCPHFESARVKQMNNASSPANLLTRREVEVLALIGEAKSDDDIACSLDIAPSTVQGVRGTLMYKLGLQSTPQLVCFAREEGYTEFAVRRAVGASKVCNR